MKVIGQVALVIVFTLCMTESVSGLKCYFCTQIGEDDLSKCTKDFSCGILPCSKTVGTAANGNSLTVRGCGTIVTKDCVTVKVNNAEGKRCTCADKDNCNGSEGLRGSFFWSLGLVAFTTILNFI